MSFFKKSIIFLLLALSWYSSLGQQTDLGSWNILNLKYTLNEHWSVFGEAQIRSLRFYDDFHYHELKGGVNYKALPQMQLTLGVGDYDTYREGGTFVTPKNNDELRIWPQVVFSQSLGKFKMEHRYRTELRFANTGNYRTRFRYRIGLAYPFGRKSAAGARYQLNLSNELFFGTREPYFERTRLNLALSKRISPQSSLQVGYVYQFDYRINDEIGRGFFQIGLFFEWKKKKTAAPDDSANSKEN
jgi:Protein of unknown function (DUF2490)